MQEKFFRPVLTFLLKLMFGLRVHGMEHYRAAGDKVIIIANHQSFLDLLLLAVAIPEKPAFAMNIYQAQKWYFRGLAKFVTIYKLDPSQPMSMKTLLTDLKKGGKVVVFPEGRITVTGGVMKIYDGAAMMLEKTGATLLPVHVEGAQYSILSKLQKKQRTRLFARVSLHVGAPVFVQEGKKITSLDIYDILTEGAYQASNRRRSFMHALLEARHLHGKNHVIATDLTRQKMNYQQLFTRSFILADKLKPYIAHEPYVGLLLPNALAAMVTFTALHSLGKTPCMLNFSAGEANILHACKIACVKTVLTSRVFIEKGKLEGLITALQKDHVVIFLEDIRASIDGVDKLKGAAKALLPSVALQGVLARVKPFDVAAVLYTSGSEGVPKGVALTHENILANLYQSCARLDLTPADKLFNAMPVFHSFGLTIGMLMPMIRGIFLFLYPSPLHYRVIPELIYDIDATIMVGTDTFFQGYAHYAHPYDFNSVRLAVAGAEKLKDSTLQHFSERFGVRIMQGYGVTETSPVIACNTPLYHKTGSVGRVFPGMECRIEAVQGIDRGGRLWVRGANVMAGYLKADQPGVIQPQGEWYDTGDIVEMDEQSFITILGRAKRFAKIAGEMISLQAVEDFVAHLLPDFSHAAIAIPDERKGEQVVLFTESQDLIRQTLIQAAKAHGVPEVNLPKQILTINEIPRLGNGKIDYPALSRLYSAS